jgi:hypothetical protein
MEVNMLLMKTANGIEHGLLNTLINQVPKSKRFKNVEPGRKAELEKRAKDNAEIVEVQYINYKNQDTGHRCADYTVGAGEPLYMFKFLHGHTYRVPKGLVNHINDPRKRRPRREGSVDESGQPREKDGAPQSIDAFVRPF